MYKLLLLLFGQLLETFGQLLLLTLVTLIGLQAISKRATLQNESSIETKTDWRDQHYKKLFFMSVTNLCALEMIHGHKICTYLESH